MQAVSLRFIASPSPDLRERVREMHFAPAPTFEGFSSRNLSLERWGVQGRYLITDLESVECFLCNPFLLDPAFARIASHPQLGPVEVEPIEEIAEAPLVRPIFIVSSPRAGSTLLYEILAASPALWSVGGESRGVIEGIPALHPAYRGYQSHSLGKDTADPNTAHALRCAFMAEIRDYQGWRYLAVGEDKRPQQIRMLEKTPENALRIPFLKAVFSDALFIYLTREACQNVSSMVEAWQHAGFVNIPALPGWDRGGWHLLLPPRWQQYQGRSLAEIAAFQWAAANEAILDSLPSLQRDRWISLDYRELTTYPEAVLRRLCAFLDIPFDQHLACVVRRPLPLSSTTIRYPSPNKWRYNPDFTANALNAFDTVVQRVNELRREMAPSIQSKQKRSPVRFRCFLDECYERPLHEPGAFSAPGEGQALIVDPSFHFQLGTSIPLPLVQRARFRERFLEDYPLVWVEHPATRGIQPFWVQHRDIWLLRSFVANEAPPHIASEHLHNLLFNAGILVTAQDRERWRELSDTRTHEAAKHFANHDYCSLSELIHPAHLRAIGRYYRELIAQGGWKQGDDQVAGRYGWYNELLVRFLHHQLTRYVARILDRLIKPSYAYVSAYQGGAILERHVDREQCEFTMSLLVERTSGNETDNWPLYLETPTGVVEAMQSPGEAILFRGTTLPHSRPRLGDGQTYMSLLFHYVSVDFTRTLY